jgi:hypothetical protein
MVPSTTPSKMSTDLIAQTVRLQAEKSQSTPLLSFMHAPDEEEVGRGETQALLPNQVPPTIDIEAQFAANFAEAYSRPLKEIYDFRPLVRVFAFTALGVSLTCLEIVNHYSVDHDTALPSTLTAGRVIGGISIVLFYVSMLEISRI